ncbi:MAG: amidohydrolase [Desulfosalsimonadaceae bacterium]
MHRAGEKDIVITNGIVVTQDDSGTIVENGSVCVSGDRISYVGNAGGIDLHGGCRLVDAAGGIIMPGLINTHTHAAMTCFRGLADDMELMDWLNKYILPAEAGLDYETVYTAAKLACAEMMLSGTTCFSDMYLFEDAVAEAAHAAGMRAVVGEVLYDFDSPNYGSIDKGFEYTRRLIEKWREDPLVTIAVEPHSPYLCAPDLLERAGAMAEKYDIPLIIHLAETREERATLLDRYGKSSVAHLADIGVLSPRVLACHCVDVDETDIGILSSCGAKVSHNPESNMKLASGIAPVPAMMEAGICVGLGTDGPASNNNLDMFMEMDTAAKIHKATLLDPTVMNARSVLAMATRNAARALGLENITGSLEIGKKADIIVVDTNKPHMTPMYDVVSHLVYSASGSDVATVLINGRLVVENGTLLAFDVYETMAAMRRASDRIRRIHNWRLN